MNKTQIQRFVTYIQVELSSCRKNNVTKNIKKKISMLEYDSIEKKHSYYID